MVFPGAAGWMEIAFSSSFSYNGTSNLVIAIDENTPGYSAGSAGWSAFTSGSNTGLYFYNDTTNADPSAPPAGTLTSNINYVTLLAPSTAPPNPAVLVGPADGSPAVPLNQLLSWASGGGSPVDYDVYLSPDGTTWGAPVSTHQVPTSYDPALAYEDTWYWKVDPWNTYGYASSVHTLPVWNFTVRTDPTVSPPYSVNFGTLTTEWLPTDWTKYSGVIGSPTALVSGGGSWYQDDWLNVTAPANKSAKINIYGTSAQGWLMTPPINMGGAGHVLEFDVAYMAWNGLSTPPVMDGTGDYFAVLVGDGNSWSPANIVRQWDNAGGPYVLNNINPAGEHVMLDMSGYTGSYQVAFYAHNGGAGSRDNDLMVDNVVYRVPPAGAPAAPLLSSPGDHTAGWPIGGFPFTWSPDLVSGAAPQSYNLYIVDAASMNDPTDPDEFFGLATMYENVNSGVIPVYPYGYLGTYYWTVEALITGEPSAYTWPAWEFTIQDEPVTISTLPYGEDFEAHGDNSLPTGWNRSTLGTGWIFSSDYSSTYWTIPAHTVYACANDDASNNDSSMDLLLPPMFNLAAYGSSQVQLKFDSFYTGAYGQMADVEISTNGLDWVVLFDVPSAADWTTYTVPLSPYLAAPFQLRFHSNDAGTWASGWAVDNFLIEEVPALDAAPVSIDMSQVYQPGPITPMATVINNGSSLASFNVTMQIGAYSDTQPVVDLPYGSTVQVVFNQFTPATNTLYTATVQTFLTGDVVPGNDTISGNLACLDLNIQAYADGAYDPGTILSGPCTFNLSNPGVITDLPAANASANFMPGADWIPGPGAEWWGNDYGTTNFWNIDPISGLQTDLGETGTDLNGIAYNPNLDVWYGASSTALYTFDGVNPPVLVAGFTWPDATPWAGIMIGIAYDKVLNVLYGVDIGYDAAFSINPTTGVCTPLGFYLGPDLNYAQDCAVDQDTGFLYLAGYTTTGVLYWIDTATGIAYTIGSHMNGSELTGFAIPYGGLETPMVTIALDGTLSWPAIAGADSYNVYESTDPYGTFTLLGNTALTTYPTTMGADKKFYYVQAINSRGESRPLLQKYTTTDGRERVVPNGRAVRTPAHSGLMPRK